MKTIMVIDGGLNCAYDCFGVEDDMFATIFPEPGQDIEFIEDVLKRLRKFHKETGPRVDFSPIWENYIERKNVQGIDGILFYELTSKRKYYPTKRDSDLDGVGRAKVKRSLSL